MNIFAVDRDPEVAAQCLPDKHVVKMPLETCQMLSIIFSPWYRDWGTLPKKDGTPYNTAKGAFRNHPCTIWANESDENLAWLIAHGVALCKEYSHRYGKKHACESGINAAIQIFRDHTGHSYKDYTSVVSFARAMPDDLKFDDSLDDIQAYRLYLNTKTWVSENYLRVPSRLPDWIQI